MCRNEIGKNKLISDIIKTLEFLINALKNSPSKNRKKLLSTLSSIYEINNRIICNGDNIIQKLNQETVQNSAELEPLVSSQLELFDKLINKLSDKKLQKVVAIYIPSLKCFTIGIHIKIRLSLFKDYESVELEKKLEKLNRWENIVEMLDNSKPWVPQLLDCSSKDSWTVSQTNEETIAQLKLVNEEFRSYLENEFKVEEMYT